MGPLRSFLLLALLLPLGACGDDPATIRIRILTAEKDGPIDVGVYLEAQGKPPRARFPLKKTGEDGLFVVEAPTGNYTIQSEEGWGHLLVKPRSVRLDANPKLPPYEFYFGRGKTLFVSMRDRNMPDVSPEWVVERVAADGARSLIPAEVFYAFNKVVGIRPAAGEWKGRLLVSGRRVDDRLIRPQIVDLTDRAADRPLVRLMITAPAIGYPVRLIAPAGADDVADGYAVELTVQGHALPERHRGTSKDGQVVFPAVTLTMEGLALTAGPSTIPLDGKHAPAYGAAHVLALTEATMRDLRVTVGADRTIDEVRVLPDGRDQYARVQVTPGAKAGELIVRTGKGRQRLLVRSGGEFAMVRVAADAEAVEASAFIKGGSISGEVGYMRGGKRSGLTAGSRLLFLRHEGERRVAGEGLDLMISPTRRFRAALPPGTYTVRIQGPRGLLGAPFEQRVGPGAIIRRNFDLE